MGSVTSEIECPQCGGRMYTDYYCKTDEAYMFCECCGRYERWTLVRDSKGKEKIKRNGKAKYKHVLRKGYGCICFVTKEHGSSMCTLHGPFQRKKKAAFFEFLKTEDAVRENCYMTKWDGRHKRVISVYGEIPV